ncbi:hypothetical protein MTR67_024661 [Solanum verrucosum]|uniref:Uncharacterized protein n=1 Tax=Solanum verrucosum TaxID=315347 RepID=A0AAF0QXE7_SOLVR|nr:hypothetical protein MTR67_024661 [Solanum verrucosum]
MHESEVEVKIDTQFIPKRASFKYLDSIIQGNIEIDKDATHHIGVRQLSLKKRTAINHKVPSCNRNLLQLF